MNRHNDAHAYTYKQTDTQTVKHIDPRRQAYRHTAGSGMCDYIYIIRKKSSGNWQVSCNKKFNTEYNIN